MGDLAYEIDELIRKATGDLRFLSHHPSEEYAKSVIESEYPDGGAPFTTEDFLNRWETLYEFEVEAPRRKRELQERATIIRAMETIARCVNDEAVYDTWLMYGVPEGMIDDQISDEEIALEYEDDESFKELLDTFLILMARARKSGGLYAGGVVSNLG